MIYKFETNSYGSVVQKIYFFAPLSIQNDLIKYGIFEKTGSTSTSVEFIWHRLTSKTGNDEDIIFELRIIIGNLMEKISINWEKTIY